MAGYFVRHVFLISGCPYFNFQGAGFGARPAKKGFQNRFAPAIRSLEIRHHLHPTDFFCCIHSALPYLSFVVGICFAVHGLIYTTGCCTMQDEKQLRVVFKERILALMDERGLTQDDLAAAFKISQAAVSRWVNKSIPKPELLVEISKYFQVPVGYLLGIQPAVVDESCPDIGNSTTSIKKVKISELEKAIAEMRSGLERLAEAVESLKRE